MKINWKLRFQNKTTLTAILVGLVGLIYQILGLMKIVPSISESDVINVIGTFVNLLVLLGVVVDPTTEGISDSNQAMTYKAPKEDYNFPPIK